MIATNRMIETPGMHSTAPDSCCAVCDEPFDDDDSLRLLMIAECEVACEECAREILGMPQYAPSKFYVARDTTQIIVNVLLAVAAITYVVVEIAKDFQ
jgi:hypothetical protein